MVLERTNETIKQCSQLVDSVFALIAHLYQFHSDGFTACGELVSQQDKRAARRDVAPGKEQTYTVEGTNADLRCYVPALDRWGHASLPHRQMPGHPAFIRHWLQSLLPLPSQTLKPKGAPFRFFTCLVLGTSPNGSRSAGSSDKIDVAFLLMKFRTLLNPAQQVGFGVWRSLVARLTGGQEVVGSNPAIPTFEFLQLRKCWEQEKRLVLPYVCPARIKSFRRGGYNCYPIGYNSSCIQN